MFFRLFTSRRSSIPQLLLRHYSIKVSPLKKHSLIAQILRHGAAQKLGPLHKAASKEGLLSAGGHPAIPLQTSSRLVPKQLPPPVSSNLSVVENVKDQDCLLTDDKDLGDGSVKSRTDSEGAHHSDYGFTTGPSNEARSTFVSHDDDLIFMLSEKFKVGGMCVDADAHDKEPFIPMQCDMPECENHHSQANLQSRRRKASKVDYSKAYIASNNSIGTLQRVQNFQKHPYSAAELGDERWNCSDHVESTTQTTEGDELLKGFSGMITQKTKEFRKSLEAKIDLLHAASVPLVQVKELLTNPLFLSAAPDEWHLMLKLLRDTYKSSEMALKTSARSPAMFYQLSGKVEEEEVQSPGLLPADLGNWLTNLDDEKWKPVELFLAELGLSATSIMYMIYKCPLILTRSVDKSIHPVVDFLKNLGMPTPSFLQLLRKRPILLSLSLESELLPLYGFFKKLGLSDEAFLMTLSVTNCFKKEWVVAQCSRFQELGFSTEAFLLMTNRDPRILKKSSQCLRAYLYYLLHVAKRDISEIVSFPSCFSYSLTGRVIPRLKLVEGLSKPVSLSAILVKSNSDFSKWYKGLL